MGVWLPLVSCLVVMGVPHEAPFLPDEPLEDLDIRRWVDRSRAWAEQLTDLERAEEAVLLADCYVQLQQFRTAFMIISGIKEPTARRDAIIFLCGSLASHGDVALALRLGETLPDREEDGAKGERVVSFPDSPRARVLRLIALFRMVRGDVEGALAATRQISDERTRATVLLRVAEVGGKAGYYDAAEDTLRIARQLGGDPLEFARVGELIAECRREGRKEAPKPGFLNSLRGVVGAFAEDSVPDGEGLPNHSEKRMAEPRLETAWKKLETGDVVGSRASADAFLRFVESRPERPVLAKAVDYSLLADLFLELGEKERAQDLVAKIYPTVVQGSELDEGLATFTIIPLIVSVLARAGSLQDAVRLIDKVEKPVEKKQEGRLTLTSQAWLALGASCALVGKVDFIEGLVKENRAAREKALLSLGVAIGLMERRRQ